MTTVPAKNSDPRAMDSVISTPPLDWSSADFFPEPERLGCLNILYHLSPYTNDPLVVLGARGSGRSTLLGQLSAKSEDNWRMVTVRGFAGLSARDFGAQLAQAFGLTAFADDDSKAWIAGMLAHFRHLTRAGQHPILLVDDVDLLPQDVQELLRSLAQEIKLNGELVGLVFTALPGFSPNVLFGALRELGGHLFELSPIDETSARKLIAHQLQRHGLSPSTLDERALDAIVRNAHGSVAELVAHIASLVPAQLSPSAHKGGAVPAQSAELEPVLAQGSASPKAGITKLPVKRRATGAWLIGGALAGALLVALVFQDRINEWVMRPENVSVSKQSVEPAVEPALESVPPAPESTLPIEETPLAGEALLPPASIFPTHDATQQRTSEVPQALGEPAAPLLPDLPSAAESTARLATIPTALPQNLERADTTPPHVESILVAEVEEVPPTVHDPADDPAGAPRNAEAMTSAVVSTPTQSVPEATSAPVQLVLEQPANQPPTVLPTVAEGDVAPSPAQPDSARTEDIYGDAWYLQQSAEDFTVQIMALRDHATLQKIASRIKAGTPVGIYTFKRESGLMYALTYGHFSSREAAQSASEDFPKELGKVQPWVRKFKLIQREIRDAGNP